LHIVGIKWIIGASFSVSERDGKSDAMFRSAIPLGRIFGISIRIHYSWFFIFAFVTWSLATGYFRQEAYQDWPLALSVIVGVVTSAILFSSVLAHELAHSLVAKRSGIAIHSITLFILGGVARITEEPKRPGAEFGIAIAGPLTSIVIGLAFLFLWSLTLGVYEPVAAMAFWLGVVNLWLAALNLIPGFPLDGGRVLRSILWWRTKDLRKSTRTASIIGRGVGFLFIFGGILWAFWIDLSGLMLAFIGWFLQDSAAESYRQLEMKDIIEGHKVRELMTSVHPAIPPTLTLERLVNDYILTTGRGYFPVVEEGFVLGLVTVRDAEATPRDQWAARTVGEAMTPIEKLKWVQPDDDLSSAMRLMNVEGINQVPVVEGGNIVGVVTRDRLLNFIDTRAKLGL
jgi:Zn-dependent protease/predicted transcriptional regulator